MSPSFFFLWGKLERTKQLNKENLWETKDEGSSEAE